MSSRDQAIASVLAQVALSFDGAILGVALAYAAARSLLKFASNSSALRKLRKAPSVHVSDLRSLLQTSPEDHDQSQPSDDGGKLVVVRGTVEAKSAIEGNWKSFRPNVLVAPESGERAVIVERTQTVCEFVCGLKFVKFLDAINDGV